MTEDAFTKLRKHMEDVDSSNRNKNSQWVPYEAWRMTNDMYMETLREVYDLVHQMNMDRGFSMDMQIGDVHVSLVGDSKDKDSITAKGQEIIGDVFERITKLGDTAMKMVAAREKEKRKVDESNKGFG